MTIKNYEELDRIYNELPPTLQTSLKEVFALARLSIKKKTVQQEKREWMNKMRIALKQNAVDLALMESNVEKNDG